MKGLFQWDTDASTYQSNADKTLSLCCIPAETVMRYIGRGGNEAKDYMSCFWRYTRLFHTLQRYNKQYIISSISHQSSTHTFTTASNTIKISPRPPSASQPSRLVTHRPSSANSSLNGRRPSMFTTIKVETAAAAPTTSSVAPSLTIPPSGHQHHASIIGHSSHSPRATSPQGSHRRSTARPHSANSAIRKSLIKFVKSPQMRQGIRTVQDTHHLMVVLGMTLVLW
eukprot:gene31133-38475_t